MLILPQRVAGHADTAGETASRHTKTQHYDQRQRQAVRQQLYWLPTLPSTP